MLTGARSTHQHSNCAHTFHGQVHHGALPCGITLLLTDVKSSHGHCLRGGHTNHEANDITQTHKPQKVRLRQPSCWEDAMVLGIARHKHVHRFFWADHTPCSVSAHHCSQSLCVVHGVQNSACEVWTVSNFLGVLQVVAHLAVEVWVQGQFVEDEVFDASDTIPGRQQPDVSWLQKVESHTAATYTFGRSGHPWPSGNITQVLRLRADFMLIKGWGCYHL